MEHRQVRKSQAETKKSDPVVSSEHGEGASLDTEVASSPAEIMYLQRTIGNQATKRLLQTRRTPVIQRTGPGDAAPAVDPAAIPAPAPALDPDVAREQFTTLAGTALTNLRSALTITENSAEAAAFKPSLESARDQIQAMLEKLRGQPAHDSVDMAIGIGESSLEVVTRYVGRLDHHIKAIQGRERDKAASAPNIPAIWQEVDMPVHKPAPTPAPAPAPVMAVAPGRAPVMIPGAPGSKKDAAKGAVFGALGEHKIEKDVGLIGGQDGAKMAENAHSHYAKPPDLGGAKTAALFAPLGAVGAQVKSFSQTAADTVVGWLHPLLAFLDSVPGVSILVGLVTTGKAAHSAYKRRKSFFEALKAARIRGDESRVPTKADMQMQKSSKYAYHKTNRAFWGNIGRFFASLVKYIFRLITILTGGTSALVTETAALVIDIAQAVEAFGRRIKGVIKRIFGRRGKHRRENAATVYKHALDGDQIALKLLVELKPFGTWEAMKAKLPSVARLPDSESAMLAYIQAHSKPKEEKAMIMEIANKMKST